MRKRKLKVEIREDIIGGELFGYTLLVGKDSQMSGIPIYDADEMRKIAKVLLKKANEIE